MTSRKAVARLPFLVLVPVLCVYLNSNVWAQDDGETGTLHRTIVVHPMSTGPKDSGTELLEAMASITEAAPGIGDAGPGIMTASATNPWLIKLDAGVYDLGTASLVMKPYVDIEGSGEGVTKITAVGNNSNATSGTVIGASNAELRFLTVENTGGGTFNAAVIINSASPKLTHVTLSASTGNGAISVTTVGLFIGSASSSPVELTDVRVIIAPAALAPGTQAFNLGIWFGSPYAGGGRVRLRDVTVSVGAITSTTPGLAFAIGIETYGEVGPSSLMLEDVTIVAADYGLTLGYGTPPTTVNRSTINGGKAAVAFAPFSTGTIGSSQLIGGVSNEGATLTTCVGDYNGSYSPLNSSCQ
jgi:hypothetical protein